MFIFILKISFIFFIISSKGGLKAVVWTDAVQTTLMFGTYFVILIKGTIDIGGLEVVIERNRESGRLEYPE